MSAYNEGEREPTQDEVDEACKELRRTLDKMDRDPEVAILNSQYDQFGAELRDMGEEEWEDAVKMMVETTDLTEDQVRNWFGRLSGKCSINDATWTGR